MNLERDAVPQTAEKLLGAVDAGTLGLPEFQRDFIWKPGHVVDLLRTVARDWPCGTFLLQKGDAAMACKSLEGAPPLKPKLSLVVLDGQQRITALYQALREKGTEIYFVLMRQLEADGEIDDDHIQFLRVDKYRAKYPTLKDEAESGVIRVSTLSSDTEFFEWANFLEGDAKAAMIRLREKQLPGFKHYSIPSVVLSEDLPLAAVAKIFETINRTGVRLDIFDLMVAKLYPHEFKLRDAWADAVAEHDDTFGRYEIPGTEVLKLIALSEHMRQRSTGAKITIKGVRESDVLDLSPETVRGAWDWATGAYHMSLRFAQRRLGAVSKALLPSRAMLLPLAANLGEPGIDEKSIERWYWSACFRQDYAQGANTQVVADAIAMLEWRNGSRRSLDSRLKARLPEAEDLRESRRRNEILLRAMCCALVREGALDWIAGEALQDVGPGVEIQQVFQDTGRGRKKRRDEIVNFTPQSAATLRSLRKLSTSDVAAEYSAGLPYLASHAIPESAFRDGNFEAYVESRSSSLIDLFVRLTNA